MLNRGTTCGVPDLLALRLEKRRREAEASVDREIARLARARRRMADVDAEVLLAAVECFGSAEGAARWLTDPEILLGEAVPLEVVASPGGKERVLQLLSRLGAGMLG